MAVWASVWGVVWLAGLCSLVRIQAPYEARGFWCIAAPPLPSWSQVKADNPTTTNFLQYALLMFFQTKPTPTTVCNHRTTVRPWVRALAAQALAPHGLQGPWWFGIGERSLLARRWVVFNKPLINHHNAPRKRLGMFGGELWLFGSIRPRNRSTIRNRRGLGIISSEWGKRKAIAKEPNRNTQQPQQTGV